VGGFILNKFAQVHPYVKDRVRVILDVADRYGGRYSVTSGYRSPAKQQELYNDGNHPGAARPGCSQHQYGLAMDVFFEDRGWQEWYQWAAGYLGLVTVPGDNVHVQAYPGNIMRTYLVEQGLCPDPDYSYVRPCHQGTPEQNADCSFWLSYADSATSFYS